MIKYIVLSLILLTPIYALKCYDYRGVKDFSKEHNLANCGDDTVACAIVYDKPNVFIHSVFIHRFCAKTCMPGPTVECCFEDGCNGDVTTNYTYLIIAFVIVAIFCIVFIYCSLADD